MTSPELVWVKVSDHDGWVAYMPRYPQPVVEEPAPAQACSCCCHQAGVCQSCGEPA